MRLPHHDGSSTYVDDEAPRLGDPVTVRMRSHVDDPMDVTHYRFLIVRGHGQQWLAGNGLVDIDLPDATDFKLTSYAPAPDWARDGVVYQVFPDRFARSAAADERPTPAWAVPARWTDTVIFESADPRTPLQFFGGDLDGTTERLDHLDRVGADIVYTTPVFPGESNHRYNATTFDEVDPFIGGDSAYERLSRAVHERGWRILGDLTTNHTGDTHDATGDVDGDGWHGTMNYSGFSWPLWSWLRSENTTARAFGRPVQVARRGGPAVVETFRAWQGTLGWRATTSSWNILGSHDSARIRTLLGGDAALHRVAAGLQFTMPGVPMLFAGDELGLEGVIGEDSRRPMP